VIHWAIPKSVEAYYQEVGRAGRDGLPARGVLLAMRADLGRLVNFIQRDRVEAGDVLSYVRSLRAQGESLVMEAPREDRDRICLGIAERAGMVTLEPARGGRLEVGFADAPGAGKVAAICHVARNRAWKAYRAVEAFVAQDGECRRRVLLDHFGDSRAGAPEGRCCDVCDPGGLGLPDPATLTPAKRVSKRAAPVEGPVDDSLLAALKEWRRRASNGKPAYTVAHNSTLEAIAALKPSSLDELAAIKGVGPAFVERHGSQVLELVG
jgi:ATP-dependent DNA helicase RecQ